MVTILMSTYNGEKFLRQQLDSILSQKGVELSIIVRDDSSTDKTSTILDEYKGKNLLNWYSGKNLGPSASFMHLLRNAPESDYYAFADQDDYWKEDKLLNALNMLKNSQKPAIYFSLTQMADSELREIATPRLLPRLTFAESLVYSFVTGCTVVFNKQLKEILSTHKNPQNVLHDRWAYLVTQAIDGDIFFDPTPHLLYRQHCNNVIGLNKTCYQQWQDRFQRIFIRHQHIRSKTALQLLEDFGSLMTEENRILTEKIVKSRTSLLDRLSLLFDKKYKCGDMHTWIFFKLGIIMNTL